MWSTKWKKKMENIEKNIEKNKKNLSPAAFAIPEPDNKPNKTKTRILTIKSRFACQQNGFLLINLRLYGGERKYFLCFPRRSHFYD